MILPSRSFGAATFVALAGSSLIVHLGPVILLAQQLEQRWLLLDSQQLADALADLAALRRFVLRLGIDQQKRGLLLAGQDAEELEDVVRTGVTVLVLGLFLSSSKSFFLSKSLSFSLNSFFSSIFTSALGGTLPFRRKEADRSDPRTVPGHRRGERRRPGERAEPGGRARRLHVQKSKRRLRPKSCTAMSAGASRRRWKYVLLFTTWVRNSSTLADRPAPMREWHKQPAAMRP